MIKLSHQLSTFLKLTPAYLVIILLLSISFARPYLISSDTNSTHETTSQFTELTIPRLQIELDIIPGDYSNTTNTWNVSETKIHQANTNLSPNQIFLYGHNTKNILGETDQLKPGDFLDITTADGSFKSYRFDYHVDVQPEDTSVLNYAGPNRLVLLTCSGILDTKRRLMIFTPINK